MNKEDYNIFIIDSDYSTRRSLERLVSSFDITVHTFTNVLEFSQKISDINNAFLLIDINSIANSAILKVFSTESSKNFHIIVTTDTNNEKSREIAMKINASMCLQKPIDAQALFDLIKWNFTK